MNLSSSPFKRQKSITRGKVLDIEDPNGEGRLYVHIPEKYSTTGTQYSGEWCQSTLPELPELNDIVLVSYENSDSRLPIVTGNITNAGRAQSAASTTYSSFSAESASTNEAFISLIARILNMNECGKEYPEDTQYEVWLRHDPQYRCDDGHYEGVSIGLMGWHEDNAREIFKRIKSKNGQVWVAKRGPELSRGLDLTWDDYTFSDADKAIMQSLQSSVVGKAVQDECQKEYIASYIEDAVSCNITDMKSIMYYCDFANQACNAAKSVVNGIQTSVLNNLDSFHNQIYNSGKYPARDTANKNRRQRTYEKILEMEQNGELDQFTSTAVVLEGKQLLWPAPGYPVVAYGFGYKTKSYGKWHPGIDINSTGRTAKVEIFQQPCVAACKGKAKFYWGGGGNQVKLQLNGSDNFWCYYMHLDSFYDGSDFRYKKSKSFEKDVNAGDILGYVGTTYDESLGGYSSGPHLHFEVHDGGEDDGDRSATSHGYLTDPENYLLADGETPKTAQEKESVTTWPKYVGPDSEKAYLTFENGAVYAQHFKIGDNAKYGPKTLIANKTYALSSSYNPGSLTSITQSQYNKMKAAGIAAHIPESRWTIASGFRSYESQQKIYQGWVNQKGQEGADSVSARAGHSEHQSGLAVDIYSVYNKDWSSGVGANHLQWLKDHAHEYGFILRYPEGRKGTGQGTIGDTGYDYEPWHWRYVGVEVATYMKSLVTSSRYPTLEDITHITSKYPT